MGEGTEVSIRVEKSTNSGLWLTLVEHDFTTIQFAFLDYDQAIACAKMLKQAVSVVVMS